MTAQNIPFPLTFKTRKLKPIVICHKIDMGNKKKMQTLIDFSTYFLCNATCQVFWDVQNWTKHGYFSQTSLAIGWAEKMDM